MLVLQEKPDEIFLHVNGGYYSPKATLKGKSRFDTIHIYIEGCCYCIAVPCSSLQFVNATHIPWEVHEVLKTLPSMRNNSLISDSIKWRI
jgi:hypothetical protein